MLKISFAGCLGLSPVILTQLTLKMCAAASNQKLTKNPYFVVSICNHSHARLVDSSRNCTFSRGYPNLIPSYGGLVEPRG